MNRAHRKNQSARRRAQLRRFWQCPEKRQHPFLNVPAPTLAPSAFPVIGVRSLLCQSESVNAWYAYGIWGNESNWDLLPKLNAEERALLRQRLNMKLTDIASWTPEEDGTSRHSDRTKDIQHFIARLKEEDVNTGG